MLAGYDPLHGQGESLWLESDSLATVTRIDRRSESPAPRDTIPLRQEMETASLPPRADTVKAKEASPTDSASARPDQSRIWPSVR